MSKGQSLKPEQIATLLRQIDVLITNGKTLAQACKEVGAVEQSYYRWRNIDCNPCPIGFNLMLVSHGNTPYLKMSQSNRMA